jgi:pimeloyl-ACP methyl ester carboxylesterase
MFIEVNGTKLFFDVYGSALKVEKSNVIEKPTLIVLHGGHGFIDHTLYVEFWSQFSDQAQVVFLDQRGCGRSSPDKEEHWNLKTWAEDLYQFCQKLDIKNPIIAGVSMGGHVMCELVDKHPAFIGGLIFCNTEAQFILDDACNALKANGADEAAKITREFYIKPSLEGFIAYAKKCVPYYAKKAYSVEELSRCKKQPELFIHYCKNEMLQFDYSNKLGGITCPTLLLVGEASPFHLPIRAKEMAAQIKPEYVTLALISDAGAAVYKDKPQESYEIVNAFLEKF